LQVPPLYGDISETTQDNTHS